MDSFLCCITWDNQLPPLKKQELDFRMVLAPSSAKAEDSGLEPGTGQLGRGGHGGCYGLTCVPPEFVR